MDIFGCIILSTTIDNFLSQSNKLTEFRLEFREGMVYQELDGNGGDKKGKLKIFAEGTM